MCDSEWLISLFWSESNNVVSQNLKHQLVDALSIETKVFRALSLGVVVPDDGYLVEAKKLCQKHDVRGIVQILL